MRIACLFGLLISVPASLFAHDEKNKVGDEMAAAAKLFLSSLDAAQLKKTKLKMADPLRHAWHFVPDKFIKKGEGRLGVTFKKMSPRQRLFAHALVNTATSHRGFRQVLAVMTLEKVLFNQENKNPIRDPELFYLAVFGEPKSGGTWGWRLEGHHLSLNVTLIKGHVASITPSFFGANPGIVKGGKFKNLQVLADEEKLARSLVNSLSADQKKKALIENKAPRDILTGQDRKVNKGVFFPVKGIAFNELTAAQQKTLKTLLASYVEKYRGQVWKPIDKKKPILSTKKLHFAWAGSTKPGEGHYYRIQSPDFLFEYDNTQNGANHIHAVWRDFNGDFGADLLRMHYDKDHKKQP